MKDKKIYIYRVKFDISDFRSGGPYSYYNYSSKNNLAGVYLTDYLERRYPRGSFIVYYLGSYYKRVIITDQLISIHNFPDKFVLENPIERPLLGKVSFSEKQTSRNKIYTDLGKHLRDNYTHQPNTFTFYRFGPNAKKLFGDKLYWAVVANYYGNV